MMQSAIVEIQGSRRPKLFLAALAGWLLVLPAGFFLAGAVARQLQPRLAQPGSAGWMIFEWARTHVSHLDAALMFLALPLAALVVGGSALWREWCRSQALRRDAAAAVQLLARQLGTVLLAAAVLAAGGILTFAVHQLIVG
ncbi:MAG TPA: hypothetical protein VFQ24_09980 [Terriglobia bacterium]|nr:hypothetical protein [Terriglobia bacterium]